MSRYIKNGTAAIAIALLGGGIAFIPDHRRLALALLAAAALLGLIVVVMAAKSEIKFRRNSKRLKIAYLTEADELYYRSVTDQTAYEKWFADLNSWYQNCSEMLTKELSAAHSALFRDVTEGGMYHVPGFNSEHMDWKNILRRHVTNLKSIAHGYLRREIE